MISYEESMLAHMREIARKSPTKAAIHRDCEYPESDKEEEGQAPKAHSCAGAVGIDLGKLDFMYYLDVTLGTDG